MIYPQKKTAVRKPAKSPASVTCSHEWELRVHVAAACCLQLDRSAPADPLYLLLSKE